MWDIFTHKWLRVPYALNVHTDRPVPHPRATVLFIHGIGNSGGVWETITANMPKDVRIITIDLLGFGDSKRPEWAAYSAKTQARSVMRTLLQLRVMGPVIIVGHSLGSLVAVEMARRYPFIVRSLVLCSPPFYRIDESKRRLLPSGDALLREMYTLARQHPDQFVKISTLAAKLGLVNASYNLTHENSGVYMNALESTIINQTSLSDAKRLRLPIDIIYGRLDPIVVTKNLRLLAKTNDNVTLYGVLAVHEIKGPYVDAVIKIITRRIAKDSPPPKNVVQ